MALSSPAFASATALRHHGLSGTRLAPRQRAAAACGARRVAPCAVASQSLEFYRAQEGFYEPARVFLPNAIIYSSLRRRAERSALAAAVDFFRDLAGGAGLGAAGVLPSKTLAPRDVVRAVLGGLRDGDGQAALRFASEKSRLAGRETQALKRWMQGGEFAFLLNVNTFFVAPQGRSYGEDRRSCVLCCVVNTKKGTKHAVSFAVAMDDENVWMVDAVTLN